MQKIRSKIKAFALASIIKIKVVETNTSFFAFKTLETWLHSVFFIIIVVHDLVYIFLLSFFIFDLFYVDFGSRVKISLVYLLLLFLIYRRGYKSLTKKSLSIIIIMAFHHFLNWHLVCCDVNRSTFLKTILIGFLYIKTWS